MSAGRSDKLTRLLAVALVLALIAIAWLSHQLSQLPLEEAPGAPHASPSVAPRAQRPGGAPPPAAAHARPGESREDAFTRVYDDKIWGQNREGKGHSGSGSTEENTVVYRAYLQNFLRKHAIKSVVDAGCGDWEFSKAIDWSGIDYKGFDIVQEVVAANTDRYGADNIHFFHGDIVQTDLPPADLLVSKHVLQHLPNEAVAEFLTQLPKYEHVILVNGVDAQTFSGDNRDISPGGYRQLDVRRPPFNIPGVVEVIYRDPFHNHQVLHIQPRRIAAPAPSAP